MIQIAESAKLRANRFLLIRASASGRDPPLACSEVDPQRLIQGGPCGGTRPKALFDVYTLPKHRPRSSRNGDSDG